MKTTTKRSLVTICLVLFIIATLITTILISHTSDAAAEDLPTTMNIAISDNLGGKKVAKGGSFKLLMELTYFGADAGTTTWSSIDLTVGPLIEGGAGFDTTLSKKLVVNPYVDPDTSAKYPQDFLGKTNLFFSPVAYKDAGASSFFQDFTDDPNMTIYNGSFRIAVGSERAGGAVGPKKQRQANETITFEIEIQVAEDIDAESITFGFWKTPNAQGKFIPSNNIQLGTDNKSYSVMRGAQTKGLISVNEWTVNIMSEEDDNTISELEMGPSATTLAPVDITASPMQYVISGPDDKIFIKPTLSGANATAKVGLSDGTPGYEPTDPIASGTVAELPIPDGPGKVILTVTSESGQTATYEIEVVCSYVRLSDLAVDAKEPTIPTLGLQGTFNKDTFTYTANVKPNSTVDMTATVLSGYGINQTLSVVGADCTVGATATSGTAFSVADIQNGARVTVTATAADGLTTQAYMVDFVALSDDASITAFTVAGAADTYNNDSTKATENTVDYYFYLMNETVFEGAMKITAATGATIEVENESYNENKMYALGTYTVTVAAEAGNKATYKVILAAPEKIEFVFDCDYQFLLEEADGSALYRRTYAEKGWVHGVDDKDLERYVLGQIAPLTTINTFLSKIKQNLLSLIKVYTGLDILVYDRGNLTAEYADKADSELYSIGTGWRIEFGAGATPTETIWISVLGDADGDGQIGAADSTVLSLHISMKMILPTLEYRLAGYVANTGSITANDITNVSLVIKLTMTIDEWYWKPTTES